MSDMQSSGVVSGVDHGIVSASYLFLCFNQEQFVREAVRSTFAQTLPGLQIIVSDDCSSDNTFDIVSEECANYQGPHQVVVRRSRRNLGIIGHFNELIGLASGRLIVLGAGDDVAAPDKAAIAWQCWRASDALLIGANPLVIDASGKTIGTFYSLSPPGDFSCQAIVRRRNANIFLAAFDRRLFDDFGPLDEDVEAEDQALPFRAALLGPQSIEVIDRPIASYRIHGKSTIHPLKFGSGAASLEVLHRKVKAQVTMHQGWRLEIERFPSTHGREDIAAARTLIEQRLWLLGNLQRMMVESGFLSRLRNFRAVWPNSDVGLPYKAILFGFTLSPSLIASIAARVERVRRRFNPKNLPAI